MPAPRMLVLDLDGTTLTADGQITPRDRAAAAGLQAMGVHVTIATGRLFTGTLWAARALGVSSTVAVMNGSELVDAESERVVHGRYLDPATRSLVHEVSLDADLGPVLFRSRRLHYDPRHAQRAWYLSTWTEDLTPHVHGEWPGLQDLLAAGMIGGHPSVDEVHRTLQTHLSQDYEIVRFNTMDGDSFLKVRHCVEDKGTALSRLAAERGWTAEDCVAVGDWLNDLPMLTTAGWSFAMGGADRQVLDAADEVLDAPRGGGGAVAEVARRVWGLDVA